MYQLEAVHPEPSAPPKTELLTNILRYARLPRPVAMRKEG